MDSIGGVPFESDCYLRHEAEMLELCCLAERELRAQQMSENFGLEDDVGKLVDQSNLEDWLNFSGALYGTSSIPPQKAELIASSTQNPPEITDPTRPRCEAYLGSQPDSESSDDDEDDQAFDEALPSARPLPKLVVACSGSRSASTSATSSRTRTPVKARPTEPISRRPLSLCSRRRSNAIASRQSSPSPFPQNAFYARKMVECGLDGCVHRCSTVADLRRHRQSLAHCADKKYLCPGCPGSFTREDALKRHLSVTPRCKSPGMTALRDEFLDTRAAREARAENAPVRMIGLDRMTLYDAFLREMKPESAKKVRTSKKRSAA